MRPATRSGTGSTARRERRQTSGDDFSQTERLLMASVPVARQVAIIGNRALLLSTSSRERQKLKPGVAEDVARRPGHRLVYLKQSEPADPDAGTADLLRTTQPG